MQTPDETRDIRHGEELDLSRLGDWLATQGMHGALTARQFPGGNSNLTYLIAQGDRRYVLRRPPFGTKARGAHDMGREFRVLSALDGHFPYAPRPLAHCDDPGVLGAPFYLMEKRDGLILRKDLPEGLSLSPAQARQLSERLMDVHLALHQVDLDATNLRELGKAEGYVARQINGWSERYRNARTPDVPDGEALMRWLDEHQPTAPSRAALIHNDYKFDNVVLCPDTLAITGVLDWEMATIGDPLMDLGASLAYWVEAGDPPALQAIRQMPTHLPGMLTRTELIARYAERAGISIPDFRFYAIYGLFRLAVIAQQIYYRYAQGQTRDPRFAHFNQLVSILIQHAHNQCAKPETSA